MQSSKNIFFFPSSEDRKKRLVFYYTLSSCVLPYPVESLVVQWKNTLDIFVLVGVDACASFTRQADDEVRDQADTIGLRDVVQGLIARFGWLKQLFCFCCVCNFDSSEPVLNAIHDEQ